MSGEVDKTKSMLVSCDVDRYYASGTTAGVLKGHTILPESRCSGPCVFSVFLQQQLSNRCTASGAGQGRG